MAVDRVVSRSIAGRSVRSPGERTPDADDEIALV
jgi:hypothetical protein